jgi:hypothetical protein
MTNKKKPYDKDIAGFIIGMTSSPERFDIRDNGVYLEDGYKECCVGDGETLLWNPACASGNANPRTAPLLPIPFSSHDLAAFMLSDMAFEIFERLGNIGQLDEEALNNVGGLIDDPVRRALKEAYQALDAAQDKAGKFHKDKWERYEQLKERCETERNKAREREGILDMHNTPYQGDEYSVRINRANASVAKLEEERDVAEKEAKKYAWEWKNKMVLFVHKNAGVVIAKAITPDWKPRAREIGQEIKGRYPRHSHKQIAVKVASQLAEEGITGRGGKRISEETIIRGSLKGI